MHVVEMSPDTCIPTKFYMTVNMLHTSVDNSECKETAVHLCTHLKYTPRSSRTRVYSGRIHLLVDNF